MAEKFLLLGFKDCIVRRNHVIHQSVHCDAISHISELSPALRDRGSSPTLSNHMPEVDIFGNNSD